MWNAFTGWYTGHAEGDGAKSVFDENVVIRKAKECRHSSNKGRCTI